MYQLVLGVHGVPPLPPTLRSLPTAYFALSSFSPFFYLHPLLIPTLFSFPPPPHSHFLLIPTLSSSALFLHSPLSVPYALLAPPLLTLFFLHPLDPTIFELPLT